MQPLRTRLLLLKYSGADWALTCQETLFITSCELRLVWIPAVG